MRIQRDIPSRLIIAGVRKSNLRELVKNELSRIGCQCRCIRCREVGLKQLEYADMPDNTKLLKQTYESSEGVEVFISYEDIVNDALIGFLR